MIEIFMNNVKNVMDYLKLTPNQLSKKLGVNQSTVSRWINKEMGLTLENAFLLSQFLNVPLSELCKENFDCKNYFQNKENND